MPTVNRRRFLQGLSVAVPLSLGFDIRPVLAGTGAKKAIFVYIPDGCIPSHWHPTGSVSNFTLSPMIEPLAAVRQHCVFISGLTMYEGGATHEGGMAKVATGNSDRSLDVMLAHSLTTNRPISSLYLGVAANFQNGGKNFSYLPGGKVRTPEDNPINAFNSVFGGVAEGGPTDPTASILDAAMGDLAGLRGRLGIAEKGKLDLHLDALRELEQRLASPEAQRACSTAGWNDENFTVPEGWHGYPPVYNREENFRLVGKLQMELATLALSCDRTDVVGFQWSHPVSPTRMEWTDSSQRHHDASHYGNAESQTAQDFIKLQRWYTEQFAEFLQLLASRPYGDGTLLDNSLVFLFSELGDSNRHDHRNMPFILAGGGGGTLSTGRYLHYPEEAHTKLLVSIANAMGVNIDTFGYSGHGQGGLPGLMSL
ncbi:MAG: DUF1552 domain-containing protein [Candidatus Competibacterales bacterium]